MLMTVLKGDLAVDQSKKLIKLFKKMKDFFVQFQNVYITIATFLLIAALKTRWFFIAAVRLKTVAVGLHQSPKLKT